MNEEKITLVQHLEELRKRLIRCLIAVGVAAAICFFYVDAILKIISQPAGQLVFLKPTEAFFSRIEIALYGGVFLALPVIIYQVWRFVSPGLVKTERRYLFWIVPFSYLLFVAGAALAFFVVLPVGVTFLLAYGTENIQPMISIDAYLSFVTMLLLAFGAIFQLPLVILFLTKLGLVTPAALAAKRKYAVVVIFILAGVLTPGPDIFSQFMMAIPTLLLYEISIILSRFVGPRPADADPA